MQPPEQIGFTGCLLPNLTKLVLTYKNRLMKSIIDRSEHSTNYVFIKDLRRR
jgi:hypothetical protein